MKIDGKDFLNYGHDLLETKAQHKHYKSSTFSA
jgi:hypothetical protein